MKPLWKSWIRAFRQLENGIPGHVFSNSEPYVSSKYLPIISLHIRSMWETTVMHKQVSGWTVNFGPNSPVYPLLRNTPPPILENFRFGMTKVYSEIPPHYGKLQIWDDQSLLRNTPPPHYGKLQIWDDQSLLQNTPPPHPIMENFRFGMTKVYSEIPTPLWKTSDLGWPKFTPEYPPNQPKIVREFKSKIFRIPRVTTCGDFIQPG